jgi:hypothetical protein
MEGLEKGESELGDRIFEITQYEQQGKESK